MCVVRLCKADLKHGGFNVWENEIEVPFLFSFHFTSKEAGQDKKNKITSQYNAAFTAENKRKKTIT